MANARSYQVQFSEDGVTWAEGVFSTAARRIELDGLTPGKNYQVRARAIGGTTGVSAWSNVSAQIVT